MQENLGKLDPCIRGRRWDQTAGLQGQQLFLACSSPNSPSQGRRWSSQYKEEKLSAREEHCRVEPCSRTADQSSQVPAIAPAFPGLSEGAAWHGTALTTENMLWEGCWRNGAFGLWREHTNDCLGKAVYLPPVSSLGENSLFPSA